MGAFGSCQANESKDKSFKGNIKKSDFINFELEKIKSLS